MKFISIQLNISFLCRCSVNNLCAQKCTDTGLAIECSCLPGYELALDDISCSGISINTFNFEKLGPDGRVVSAAN